jgi:hypothetical protein
MLVSNLLLFPKLLLVQSDVSIALCRTLLHDSKASSSSPLRSLLASPHKLNLLEDLDHHEYWSLQVLSDTFRVEKHERHYVLASTFLEVPIQMQHSDSDSKS